VTPPLLELRGITKRYGPARALRGVDLAFERGECVALLGPNGAGKSTILRIVAGLARATSGDLLLDGRPAESHGGAWRARLGHVSHHLMLYESLTTRENLGFAGRLHGVAQQRSRADQILRSLGLQDRADEPVRQLSRGLAQRAAVARALLHDPEILLLDEPYTGLDQASGAALTTLLHSLRRKGRLLLLVTHDLAHASALATRVVHLRQGRVIADVAGGGLGIEGLQALLQPPESAA
jgi:heme exporter protein A